MRWESVNAPPLTFSVAAGAQLVEDGGQWEDVALHLGTLQTERKEWERRRGGE